MLAGTSAGCLPRAIPTRAPVHPGDIVGARHDSRSLRRPAGLLELTLSRRDSQGLGELVVSCCSLVAAFAALPASRLRVSLGSCVVQIIPLTLEAGRKMFGSLYKLAKSTSKDARHIQIPGSLAAVAGSHRHRTLPTGQSAAKRTTIGQTTWGVPPHHLPSDARFAGRRPRRAAARVRYVCALGVAGFHRNPAAWIVGSRPPRSWRNL